MSAVRDAWKLLKRRLYVSGKTERAIVDDFHKLYHQTGKIQGSWGVTWRGIRWISWRLLGLFRGILWAW